MLYFELTVAINLGRTMVNNSAIVSLNHDLGSSGQKSDLESPSPPPPPVSPVRDVTPLPLPDLQLAVVFVINGKTLEDTKEQTVKIEQDYHGFMYDIQLLCDSRLPRGIRWSSEGVDIVWKRAWISPMQMKGMEKHGKKKEEPSFRTFEDEGDFNTLRNVISVTKNPRQHFLVMKAFITIDKGLLPKEVVPEQAVEPRPATIRLVYILTSLAANSRRRQLNRNRSLQTWKQRLIQCKSRSSRIIYAVPSIRPLSALNHTRVALRKITFKSTLQLFTIGPLLFYSIP